MASLIHNSNNRINLKHRISVGMGNSVNVKGPKPTRDEIEAFTRQAIVADQPIYFSVFTAIGQITEIKGDTDILTIFVEYVAGQLNKALMPKYSSLPDWSVANIVNIIRPAFDAMRVAGIKAGCPPDNDFMFVQLLSDLPPADVRRITSGLLAVIVEQIYVKQCVEITPASVEPAPVSATQQL